MHEVLVNRLGGLSLPRKSVARLTDRPDMTLDVYRGRKTTIQQQQPEKGTLLHISKCFGMSTGNIRLLNIIFLALLSAEPANVSANVFM